MEGNSNKVLFLFDVVFDLDIGLLNLIKKEFRNKDLMYIELLDNAPIDLIKKILIEREDPNPLSIIMDKDKVTMEDIDDLYAQFMYERYSDIVKYSIPTDVAKLLNRLALADSKIATVYVACKDPEEVNMVRLLLQNLPKENYNFIPYRELISEIPTNDFDTIVIKSYYDVLRLKDIGGKNIIVADCNYNKVYLGDELVLNPEISLQIADKVELSTVELYHIEYDEELEDDQDDENIYE